MVNCSRPRRAIGHAQPVESASHVDPFAVAGILQGMSSTSAVHTAALQLARRERAELARQLIASLDDDADGASDDDVEAAWLAEVEQRVAATARGAATFEPWEVAEERIAARLRDVRP